MLGISQREHRTNEYVWQQVSILAAPQELLLSTVKRRKLNLKNLNTGIAIHETVSPLWELVCHMGSQSFTYHPTKATFPS